MKIETYIKKYKGDKTKMFCKACQLPTSSAVWCACYYFSQKDDDKPAALEKIAKIGNFQLEYVKSFM